MDKQQAKVSELGVPLRKRVAKACDQCRRRKTKCDGQPHCNTCNSVGLKCSYGDPTKQMRGPTYVLHLERRVDELQDHIMSGRPAFSVADEEYWQPNHDRPFYTTSSSTNANAIETYNNSAEYWPYFVPWTNSSTNSQVPQHAHGAFSWPGANSMPSASPTNFEPATFPATNWYGTTAEANCSLHGSS